MPEFDLVYSPHWFYGKDIAIDFVSIIVLLLIAFFSYQCYKTRKTCRNPLWLAVSFFLLALSFAAKILVNFTLYREVLRTESIGPFSMIYETMAASPVLFIAGFFAYRVLTLLGLYMLYSVYSERQSFTTKVLIMFFILMSTHLSYSSYYAFHVTALALLALTTYTYIQKMCECGMKTSLLLAFSYGLITLSQFFFIFIRAQESLYVIGEAVQLVGYLLLAFIFLRALYHGKKACAN
ncbi:MAG TPA: hypothetical protein VJI75_05640 [Candidatus Nanoarchaeia archaeon]|nr:hypothetical protein [Candidatus Nanoarchaeia archaeon]